MFGARVGGFEYGGQLLFGSEDDDLFELLADRVVA